MPKRRAPSSGWLRNPFFKHLPLYTNVGTEREKANNMRYCPECGGELQYTSLTKRYVCKSCGLSLTPQELYELREKQRPRYETDEEQRQQQRKDYLKWWLGKKK
jgi:hypothetical protein